MKNYFKATSDPKWNDTIIRPSSLAVSSTNVGDKEDEFELDLDLELEDGRLRGLRKINSLVTSATFWLSISFSSKSLFKLCFNSFLYYLFNASYNYDEDEVSGT